jgi:trk system potassium uptake protein TrkH
VGAEVVLNAVALVLLSLAALAGALSVLLVTQEVAPRALVFEAVSAFGTVGLSLGATAGLDPLGKLCIVVLMFVGRVGPLTVLVMMRPARQSNVAYPAENVMVG